MTLVFTLRSIYKSSSITLNLLEYMSCDINLITWYMSVFHVDISWNVLCDGQLCTCTYIILFYHAVDLSAFFMHIIDYMYQISCVHMKPYSHYPFTLVIV